MAEASPGTTGDKRMAEGSGCSTDEEEDWVGAVDTLLIYLEFFLQEPPHQGQSHDPDPATGVLHHPGHSNRLTGGQDTQAKPATPFLGLLMAPQEKSLALSLDS